MKSNLKIKLTKNEKLTVVYALVTYNFSLKALPHEKKQYEIKQFHRKNVNSILSKLGMGK